MVCGVVCGFFFRDCSTVWYCGVDDWDGKRGYE